MNLYSFKACTNPNAYPKGFSVFSKHVLLEKCFTAESDTRLTVILSSSLGGIALLLGILIGFLGWKIRRQRQDFEIQTQKAIEEFRNGIQTENMPEETQDANFSILQMPYNEAFEIPQNKWKIGKIT